MRAVIVALIGLAMGQAIAAPPPLEVFAAANRIRSVEIAPDGKHLAIIRVDKGRTLAIVVDWPHTGHEAQPVLADVPGKVDIAWCAWANNVRLVCGYRGVVKDGDSHFIGTRMAAVDADGRNAKVLLQNSDVVQGQFQDDVIDWHPGPPDTVLVAANQSTLDPSAQSALATGAEVFGNTQSEYPAVFRLNIRTGGIVQEIAPHAPIRHFLTDGHGHVRVGYGYLTDRTLNQYFVRTASGEWKSLLKFETFARQSQLVPDAVDPHDDQTAYAIGGPDDLDGLWKIDLGDRDPPRLLYSNPLVDVGGPLMLDDGTLYGVFYETERPHIRYTDEGIRVLMEHIDATLPDTFNVITGSTADHNVYVVHAISDREPGTFYLFDASQNLLTTVGRANAAIDPEQLGRMLAIHYPARDGVQIPGYLTRPPGHEEEQHLPLIVMPHGGPIARESWEYDFLQQFLVSRGYAVLQPNFRGSSGYGGKWYKAAHQDWGGVTYNDIVDGVQWAVKSGAADPKRVAIVGWSFGGYAALLGAVRGGDLFKCSVSIAGISDLSMLERESDEFTNSAIAREQIGKDRAKLKQDSPRLHADDVRMPVLMLHGDNDPQVEVEQSRAMAAALKKAGKTYEYVEFKGADHQIRQTEDRVTMLRKIGDFVDGCTAAH